MTKTSLRTPINGIDLQALDAIIDGIRDDASQAIARFHVATRWTGGTRSEAVVKGFEIGSDQLERRFTIVADEPAELLGQDSAPNPQELLMGALNACLTVGHVAMAAVH
jgi:organic hydroperoxide reductase OsmC/OhrA